MPYLFELIKDDGEEIPLWVDFKAYNGTKGDSEDPSEIEILGASKEYRTPFINDFPLDEKDKKQLIEKIAREISNENKYEYDSDSHACE